MKFVARLVRARRKVFALVARGANTSSGGDLIVRAAKLALRESMDRLVETRVLDARTHC